MSDLLRCGDTPTGVDGCTEDIAIWLEFTEIESGMHGASVLCDKHASMMRAGFKVWNDPEWGELIVTRCRSFSAPRKVARCGP